jgi:hypothetical protein
MQAIKREVAPQRRGEADDDDDDDDNDNDNDNDLDAPDMDEDEEEEEGDGEGEDEQIGDEEAELLDRISAEVREELGVAANTSQVRAAFVSELHRLELTRPRSGGGHWRRLGASRRNCATTKWPARPTSTHARRKGALKKLYPAR